MFSPPRIGLTGGIGSGKSLAAQRFRELGITVIDADQITRELCVPGQSALEEIQAVFGREILDAKGNLNRTMMRELIFRDATTRHTLEKILHPRVCQEMAQRANQALTPYVVLVIPLLIESALQNLVDRILVIDCPEELQIARVKMRDKLTSEQVATILTIQASRAVRCAVANDILINDADPLALVAQVDAFHARWMSIEVHG